MFDSLASVSARESVLELRESRVCIGLRAFQVESLWCLLSVELRLLCKLYLLQTIQDVGPRVYQFACCLRMVNTCELFADATC